MICIGCRGSNQLVQTEENNPVQNTTEQVEAETPQADEDSIDTIRQELIDLYKNEITDSYQAEANGIITYYILAQQSFFSGDYQNALIHIERAASIRENADILALKGSIYLGLGSMENFVANWRQALELDPEVPIPPSPYIVQQLQQNGLIDENLQKSF